MLVVIVSIMSIVIVLYPQPSFSFHILQLNNHHMSRLSRSKSTGISCNSNRYKYHNHFLKEPSLFMLNSNNNNDNEIVSFFQSNDNPNNSFNDTSTSTSTSTSTIATTTTTTTTPPTSTTTATNKPLSSSSIEKALNEAKALKERAEKERLEAEKMRIELTLRKIQVLEQELSKLEVPKPVIVEMEIHDDEAKEEKEDEQIKVNLNLVQKSEDLKKQIDNLKRQLDDTTSNNNMSTPIPSTVTSTPIDTDTASSSSSTSTADTKPTIATIPEDEMKKLTHRFKNFPLEIKQLYCQAINVTYNNNNENIQSIMEQLYVLDQQEKQLLSNNSNNNNSTLSTPTLLQIAHTQVGFTLLLPQPVQQVFRDSIGMLKEQNVTLVVETLLQNNKVIMTEAFGGVEFRFDDDDSGDKDPKMNSQKQQGEEGKGGILDRGFTKDEIKEAIDLFDNLPLPMKTMLASGVGLDGSNSTEVIELMIEKKKIKPSKDGVEFLVYDDSISDSKGTLHLF